MKAETIIVTRHPSLVQYLLEEGIVPEGTQLIAHAGAAEVKDKHVVGVLPLHLAALTASITVVPLNFPRDANLRGVELSLEQVREMAGPAVTYQVRQM